MAQETGGRFRVLAGLHFDEQNRSYGKGDVLESPYDLDKMFANKFERLSGPTKIPAARDDMLNFAGQVMDDPLHKRQNAATGKPGEHAPQPFVDPTPTVVKHNSMSPREEQHGHDATFPGEEHKAKPAQAKASPQAEEEEKEPDFGADMTESFEAAQDAGLEVYKNEKGFTIVHEGEPVRKKPFSSKTEVNNWIKKNKDRFAEDEEESAEESEEETSTEE